MRSTLRSVVLVTIVAVVALGATAASAAVFQYMVPVETSRAAASAYLWIPPQSEQIRGVVMAGMTLMEREFVKDPVIRRACADEQLALVFLKGGLGSVDQQRVLDRLAQASGYQELKVAPLMFVGHSAGGPPSKAHSIKMADRCFGVVQYRGGVPGGDEPVRPGISALMMIGQFDEFGGTMRNTDGRETWQGGRDAMAAFRKQHAGNLGSIVVEPGAGHFAWSPRNADYLAMFLRKAAAARIPKSWPIGAKRPPELNEIDPADGWLTDLRIESPQAHKPAAYGDYAGERSAAAWHFDREMAEATVAYHAGGLGKRDQFLRWNDPFWVDAGTRFFFTKLTWVGDGQTLEVHPVYADVYPSQHNGNGPRWPKAGEPVGHSDAPIRVRHVGGPVVAVGPNTLRMKFDNLAAATDRTRVTFLAYSPGDAEYRYTEQVGMMPRGFKGLTKGNDQTITFPAPENLKLNGGPVTLKAASDAGLPVEYYVAYGPAVVEGGRLKITEIPTRASLPIKVKVVAWQFGRGLEPLVKTAEPVERVIRIER